MPGAYKYQREASETSEIVVHPQGFRQVSEWAQDVTKVLGTKGSTKVKGRKQVVIQEDEFELLDDDGSETQAGLEEATHRHGVIVQKPTSNATGG